MLKQCLLLSLLALTATSRIARVNNPLRLAQSLSGFQKRSSFGATPNDHTTSSLTSSLSAMDREEMAALEFCFDMFAKYQDLTQEQLAQVSLDADESDILDKCYMVTQKIGMKKRSSEPKLPGGHGAGA